MIRFDTKGSGLTRWSSIARKLHANDRGAMSVEKVMLIGVIIIPILIGLIAFRETIFGWLSSQEGDLDTGAGDNPYQGG
ncbi:MAG: hypothetical protein AAGF84_00290 [Planctomycetota bacterium]